MTITELCNKYQTDKGTKSGHQVSHGYSETYDKLFEPLKNEKLNILELGLFQLSATGNGRDVENGPRSLYVWRDYFPNARVYGIDVLDGQRFSEDRITVLQIDATQEKEINKYFSGIEFDIIIDDASHKAYQILRSIEIFWPKINNGGYYIVEDVQLVDLDVIKDKLEKLGKMDYVKLNNGYSNLLILQK